MNGAVARLARKLVDDFSGQRDIEFRWDQQQTAEHRLALSICQLMSIYNSADCS